MVAKDTIVLLTNGSQTIVARVPESACETRGFFFCTIEGIRFSDIPPSRSPIIATATSTSTSAGGKP